MRNTSERVEAVQKRAAELKAQRSKNFQNIAIISGTCLSLCIIVALAFAVPNILQNSFDSSAYTADYAASIFSSSQTLSYIAIGIISFLLGISVTILCLLIKKKGDRNDS